jgi:hypothetical protein
MEEVGDNSDDVPFVVVALVVEGFSSKAIPTMRTTTNKAPKPIHRSCFKTFDFAAMMLF